MATSEAQDLLPECPRCGYDLSGQVAAAGVVRATAGQARGTCSECGLEFLWADVFDPDRVRVPGFIEQEEGGWPALLWAAWRTWWLALRPWAFWGRVGVERTPRPGRIWLWAAVLFLAVTWSAAAVATLVMVLYVPQVWGNVELLFLDFWTGGLITRDSRWGARGVVVGCPVGVLALMAATAVAPAVLMCLPYTRRLARVRGAHVLRAAVYSLAWLVPVVVLRAVWVVVMTVSYAVANGPGPMNGVERVFARTLRAARDLGSAADEASWVVFILGGLWLGLWWSFALREGWRIGMAAAVWWALAVPAGLAALIALVMKLGYRLFQ